MTLLVIAALRSLATATIVLAVSALFRRRSAALRHSVLIGGIITTAAVVPLSLLTPQWDIVPLPVRLTSATSLSAEPAQADGTMLFAPKPRTPGAWRLPDPSPIVMATASWAIGALAGLGLFLSRLRRLAKLTAGARQILDGEWRTLTDQTARDYGISSPIDLRSTTAPDIIATWGLRTPVVLVPASAGSWDSSWARVVLRHELAHVRRRDWAMQMLSETLRATLWFNPILWVLCSQLRRESECACDDMVLGSGIPVDTYASHLVDIARACRGASSPLPALPVAGPSTLERRITMLLNADRDRRLPSRWSVALILAVMLAGGGIVASVRLLAQTTTGRLVGHVYDSSGAVLPAVDVVLEDEQKTTWPTTTDSSGQFEFTPVGAGRYTLRASLPGFRSLSDQFDLRNAKDWNRSVTLQVGELEETISVTARRPVAKPAAPSTTAPEPVRIGGNIKPPVKLGNVPPVYPQAMRDAGLEGVVPIEALIAQDGTVASVRVLSAQVHPEFARAAELAVRQWRFSQTLLNGVAVDVRMTVSVHFSLTD